MEVYRWRPRSRIADFAANRLFGVRHTLAHMPARRPNFGDELGPLIVDAVLERLEISRSFMSRLAPRPTFFSIGSVLPLVRNGDHVWGTGHLGGDAALASNLKQLNVYATRGPLSAEILESHGLLEDGIAYGDPGILTPLLFPDTSTLYTSPSRGILIPHIDDDLPKSLPSGFRIIKATAPVIQVIQAVANAEMVVTSSLHAKILADSFGIPSVIYKGRTTTKFKFDDYALGSGQEEQAFAVDSCAAIDQAPYLPKPSGAAADELLRVFPKTIWN